MIDYVRKAPSFEVLGAFVCLEKLFFKEADEGFLFAV